MEKQGMGGGESLHRPGLLVLWTLLWALLCGAPVFSQTPRIFWRNLPPSLTVGEEALLVLCIERGTRPEAPAPSLPSVPAMAIMEVLAPQGDDELLALRLIPLEGPFFSLPAFPYPLGTRTLQVPALRIPVRPAPQEESAPLGESAPQGEDAAFREEAAYPEGLGFPPFPPGPEAGREIQQRSRALWEQGLRVEALAELRRNERDHPAGRSLAGLRRELEGTLGLEAEPDEIYAPRLLLIPALVLFLLLAALSLTLPAALLRVRSSGGEGGKRPLFRGWLPRGFCLVFSVAALLCLFRLSFGRRLTLNYGASSPRQALAREAALYRVPDDQGTEIARLREGQGLLVYEVRDGWAYAESRANGRAGWIRAGTYLIY